jgi:hypothetical protein
MDDIVIIYLGPYARLPMLPSTPPRKKRPTQYRIHTHRREGRGFLERQKTPHQFRRHAMRVMQLIQE